MNDTPTPSALAIRRATRVRELNRMRVTQLRAWVAVRRFPREAYGDLSKEQLINEILHLEGLDMAVLR